MRTVSRGHAGQLRGSLSRSGSPLLKSRDDLRRSQRRRMEVSSYWSPSSLAAAGAVALASLVTWGMARLANGYDGTVKGVKRRDRVEVTGGESKFHKEVLARCSTINGVYRRFWGVWNGHVETLWAAWFRRHPRVEFVRESITRPDGGNVALDYYEPKEQQPLPASAPVLILMPGLIGGSDSPCVQYTALQAYEFGIRAVVFNSRGTGGSFLTSPQFYSASYTGDTRAVIKHIASKFPDSRILCLGWSLGGNILVNYLAEEGKDTPLSAAVSLCNPFSIIECDMELSKGISSLYALHLGSGMKKLFKRNAHIFKDRPEFNLELAMNCRTVRDFDTAITHVSFGWKDVDDYYQNSGSCVSIPKVEIPLLCIQALDDPIAVERAIPREAIRNNPNCILVTTPSGGHLGWIAGEGAPFGAPWSDLASIEWLDSVLRQLESIKDTLPLVKGKKNKRKEAVGRSR